jgi:hypothetical protein
MTDERNRQLDQDDEDVGEGAGMPERPDEPQIDPPRRRDEDEDD